MAVCDDPITRAVREVTRRGGDAIWSDPGRLRSRLHYELGRASPEQSAVLDALVIAAIHGIPRDILCHRDLQPPTLLLSNAVGPLLAGEAVSTWVRALCEPEPEVVAEPDPLPEIIEPVVELEPEIVTEPEPEVVAVVAEVVEPEPEAVEPEPVVEDRVPSLLDKLRPPPPVSISV